MLIILSKSPWTQNYGSVLETARKASARGNKVAILHIQDGCLATTMTEYCNDMANSGIKLYALKADCEARGLRQKVNSKVNLVDYRQWVRLVMTEHVNIVSWTS